MCNALMRIKMSAKCAAVRMRLHIIYAYGVHARSKQKCFIYNNIVLFRILKPKTINIQSSLKGFFTLLFILLHLFTYFLLLMSTMMVFV